MERITYKDAPGVYAALAKTQSYVDNSGLDETLVELLVFRVSQINSCAYCLDMHYKDAVANGMDPIKLVSVAAWRDAPYYSPKEQAVLAFAEQLTHLPAEHDSSTIHDGLLEHFTKEEIANLTLAIVQINSWNRITRSFGPVAGSYKVNSRKAAMAELQ
jgi:AhpD family alkylhydroperoxidase